MPVRLGACGPGLHAGPVLHEILRFRRTWLAPGKKASTVRIAVIGSTGSGKTTLGKSLAQQLSVPFIELDALHWDPGWTPLTMTDPLEFIRRVDAATAAPEWVSDGNYKLVRHFVWERATHIVWLDYERRLIMTRVIRRTLQRSLRGTELWSGNREQWRNLLRPDHPVWWAWKHFRRHRREWAEVLQDEAHAHLFVLRLQRPVEPAEVLRRLQEAPTGRRRHDGGAPHGGCPERTAEGSRMRANSADFRCR